MYWQIAIDGPAAAGKSTIARLLADRLNFAYLDTGAMYRAITYKALALKINMENEAEYKFLESTSIDFFNGKLYLDGKDVSKEIRSLEVTNNASLVAKFGYVRSKLVDMQKKLAESKKIIMDGRDIGTVVLPNANLKIYLVATINERANRRLKEREFSEFKQTFEETVLEIQERDRKDMSRTISPLEKAPDAVEIDTSELSIDEVVDEIIRLVMERGYKMESVKTELKENVEKDITAESAEVAKESEKEKTPKAKKTTKQDPKEPLNEEQTEVVAEKKPAKTAKTSKKEVAQDVNKEVVAEKKPAKTAKTPKEEVSEVEDFEDNNDLDDVEETDLEDVEDKQEAETQNVREMQLVEGTVVDVLKAQIERINQQGKTVRKAKEEKLLIKLDNGQEGFLFKKDVANIEEDDDLADLFMEGDRIKAIVKRVYPDGGKVLLSTALIGKRENIRKFEDIIANHGYFNAKVIRSIRVGLILQYEDYSCLLPNSQIDVAPENYGELIGKEIIVAPIRVDYNRIRLIVSHNVAAAIQHREDKQKFLTTVEVGQVYEGTVKNIESYGAFVEIAPGVEGLLHISEIEHNRIVKVEKVINVGDTVKVKVIKVENDHIGLSRKALLPNHWKEFMDANPVNTLIKGKVIEINRAGVVLELNEHVQGFLPKSEFSWERDTFIEDFISIGDEIEVKIIELDLGKKRIILSRKQLLDNPWEVLKLRSGDKVEATVVKELSEGVKVSVQGAAGFLPKSNFGNVSNFTVGETINAKVRLFDPAKTKLIITLREDSPMDRNVVNKLLRSQEKVTSTFGDFVDLDALKKSRKKK